MITKLLDSPRVSGLAIVAVLSLVCLASCNSKRTPNADTTQEGSKGPSTPKTEASPKARTPVKDVVLGQLPEFELKSQTGDSFGSKQLHGKTWVANFFSTRSPKEGQQNSDLLAELQQRLQRNDRWDEIHLVSFTVDPEHDTQRVPREYARNLGADAKHWKFLTGSRELISRLKSDEFQLPVSANDDQSIEPSGAFALVDP